MINLNILKQHPERSKDYATEMQLFIDNLRQAAQKQNPYSPLQQKAHSPVTAVPAQRKQESFK